MRKAIVYCHDIEAGLLEESTPGRGYTTIQSHLPCLSGKGLISLIIYSLFLPICFQKEQTER